MSEANRKIRQKGGSVSLAVGSVLLTSILLSGCSSVPDYANPVHWYKSTADWVLGDDSKPAPKKTAEGQKGAFPNLPADERPQGNSAKQRTDLTKGLVADRSSAKYTQDTLNREGNPTRPLAPDASVARPAAAPASSTVASSELPPPARSAAPYPVAAQQPVRSAPQSLEEAYRRRLAEFASGVVQAADRANGAVAPSAAFAPSSFPQSDYARPAGENGKPVTLIPPSKYRHTIARAVSGKRPLEAFDGSNSAASFQVGSLVFGEGTAELSKADRSLLHDIAQIQKQNKAKIRVFGRSSSARLDLDPATNRDSNRSLAALRADAVADELIRLGVPAGKVYAGAAPEGQAALLQPAASSEESTEIFVDY